MPFASFLHACAHWALWAYLPIQLGGGDPALVGRITALYQLVSALVLLPAGWFTDRWSPRSLCLTGTLLTGLGAALFAVGGHNAMAAVLSGGGSGLFIVSLHALFYKSLEGDHDGARTGIFVAAGLLGYAMGPLIGGQVAQFGLGANATIAAVICAALAALCLRLPTSAPVPVRPMSYLRDLRSPGPLLLVLVIILTSSHGGVEYVGLPAVATELAGLTPRMQGALYAIIGMWTGMLTLGLGRAFDRSPAPVLVLAIGVGVSGTFQGLTGLAFDFGSLVGIRLAHTIGDSLFGFCIALLTAQVFPRARVGGLFALTQFVRTGTMGLFAAGTGALRPVTGLEGVFLLSGLLLVAGSAGFLVYRRDVRRAFGLPADPREEPPVVDPVMEPAVEGSTATSVPPRAR